MQGLQVALPNVELVAAGSPTAAAKADVLVTLADDDAAIEEALTDAIDWVHILGAGVDGFPIDVVGGRLLTCSRGAGAPAIAEFVLATMLAFEKHLPQSWITEPPQQWNTADLGGLEGRTLGVIGIGAIGTQVARRAVAFDMEVVALRRTTRPSPLPEVGLCPDLPSLLGRSDHVVVSAPATTATHRLLDRSALSDDGRIAQASLDVVEPEPLPSGHPLYTHPRVKLSPHISWSSPRTVWRTLELFAENLARYRSGEDLVGRVDMVAGY
jgi:phosphoglycerate dehydrogenase-like enzyme